MAGSALWASLAVFTMKVGYHHYKMGRIWKASAGMAAAAACSGAAAACLFFSYQAVNNIESSHWNLPKGRLDKEERYSRNNQMLGQSQEHPPISALEKLQLKSGRPHHMSPRKYHFYRFGDCFKGLHKITHKFCQELFTCFPNGEIVNSKGELVKRIPVACQTD